MLCVWCGHDVSVLREDADAREPHQVPGLRLRRRGRSSRWRGRRRIAGDRDVAGGGEGNGIVGERARVELDRLFVAQPDAEPEPRLVVLWDSHEAVDVAA